MTADRARARGRDVARGLVGAAFALVLLALAARSFPATAPLALIVGAGAVLLLAAGLRAVRFALVARAAGGGEDAAPLAGIGAVWTSLDVAFFRGVGPLVGLALLARRGATVARAGGAVLALVALDFLALGGLALAALAGLRLPLPEYAVKPVVGALVVAPLLAIALVTFAAIPARARDAGLPTRWKAAGLTPGGVAKSAIEAVRGAGAWRIGALTIAAIAAEASAFALAASATGVSPLLGLRAGLVTIAAESAPTIPIGDVALDAFFAMLATSAGADWRGAFAAGDLADDLRLAAAAFVGIAPALAWALRARRARALPADTALRSSEGFHVAAILALGLWVRRVQWSERLPFARRDAHEHHAYVQAVLAGDWFPLAPDFFMAYHPPLYYWLNAPLFAALGGAGYVAFNLAVSFGLALATYAILRRLDVPRAWRLGALAVATALPTLVGVSVSATNDGLVALLVALLTLAALPFLSDRATTRDAVLLGVATGAAMLTKFNAVVPAAFLALGILVAARGRIGRVHVLALAIAALVAAPWYVRNALVLGSPAVGNAALAVAPSTPGDAPFVPHLQFLDGESRASDVWGLLVQTTFWPFDAPFDLPAPGLAAIGLPRGVEQAFLLAGIALALLALAGALDALARGTRAERTLALLALGMLAAQLAYFASFPVTAAVSGSYLLPALPAYALVSTRAARSLAKRAQAARAGDPAASRT